MNVVKTNHFAIKMHPPISLLNHQAPTVWRELQLCTSN